MRFIPTNHHNSCPICQDTSGDCRTTFDNLILCHSFIDTDSGVEGYSWIKSSSNGVWGVHVPDKGKEFEPSSYERYLAQKAAQELNRKQFLARNALDAQGRDKAIRKLSRYVGLNARHREDLIRRGLSERAIEAGLFFSIDPWTRFNLSLPDNLPGIHYQGDRFATKDTGYACPIFDKQGRIIGWQLRLEGVTKRNKYKWACSSFSSHLPNGELPITIIKPKDKSSRIPQLGTGLTRARRRFAPQPLNPERGRSSKTLYLCEGVLKPFVASNRHNLAVCGAGGGHFSGSPQQLAEIVSDYDNLVITPDAGDILNPQVMQRWSKQINFLKQFNKPIKILWWGQVSKEKHQDIDEIDLLTFSQAKYLTPQEFFELAKTQQWIKQQWDIWREYKKFTPQIKIDKQFVEFGVPEKDTILFIKSALGTGKTTQLIKVLEQLPEYGILNQGYRNTLLLQFNEKAGLLGFYHLQSDKNLKEFSLNDPTIRVSNCIDSLIHYVKEQFDGKIVVLDEVISVLKHLLYSRTINNFEKVKELFTEMVNRADRIICLDGFMQDWAVKFFQEICPTKQIVTLENIHQGDKPQTYLLEGTIDINEKLKANDKTPWLQKLLQSDCPVIFSDSQIFCEASENLLLEQGRVGIRIDSKTVGEKHVKEFLKNPARWIVDNQPEYLIGSPSIESGLDISIKNYFDEHFAFFFGQLDIDSCIQMLGRVRDSSVPKYVWCKKFILPEDTKSRPSNVESIQADRARRLMLELHSTLNSVESPSAKIARLQQIYQDNLDPYTTAADTIKAIRNHEFANYRECLKEQLISNGYPVEALTLESLLNKKEIAKQEREAKTKVKVQNANDIFKASDKYIGQRSANLNFDASWETRCAVIKAQLVSSLPGINQDPVWSPEFIKLVKYDKPSLIKQTELYYLMENPALAKQLAVFKYNRIFNRGRIAAPWKLRQDYLLVKALRDIGLDDFIQMSIANPYFTYRADSPEVTAILDRCRRKKNQQVLGTPKKDPLKFLHRILRSVGVEVKSNKVKRDGQTVSVYSLNLTHFLSEERLAILRALQLKYDEKINLLNQPLSWVTDAENWLQNNPIQKSPTKIAETTAPTRIESVALPPNIYINNSTICNPKNNPDSLANLPTQTHNTNKIQNPLDSEEAISDLISALLLVENAEDLAELTSIKVYTRARLNRAARQLPLEQQQRLRKWALEKLEKALSPPVDIGAS